jgi:hypothetical protein
MGMSEKKKILLQLDTDPHPSAFDRVVAVDAGVDQLFSYGGVKPEHVRDLVHGCIFTRGPKDLHRTAIFIGGGEVSAGERLLDEARKHLLPQFGLSVSLMLDCNGANTTAAAAVLAAGRHLDLATARAVVLGGTGPVGQRVALLLAGHGADVFIASRQRDRAATVCERIRNRVPGARLTPVSASSSADAVQALDGRTLVVAAGAAGAVLLPRSIRQKATALQVAVDLNAVPPLGIEGIEVNDRGAARDGVTCYGAIGVGADKMKLHRAAVARLFEAKDLVLDVEEIYRLAGRG